MFCILGNGSAASGSVGDVGFIQFPDDNSESDMLVDIEKGD